MRRRGAKSFVDDLVLSRGVVLSRAELFCDLLRLSPTTRRFVRLRRTYRFFQRERMSHGFDIICMSQGCIACRTVSTLLACRTVLKITCMSHGFDIICMSHGFDYAFSSTRMSHGSKTLGFSFDWEARRSSRTSVRANPTRMRSG